ncbi:MAG: ATP-binding protein [Vicinamibacterales bacterium]
MPTASDHDPFHASGEMAGLMRALDWSRTPLGPVDGWPHSLRTVVRVLLTSRFAMWLGWGPDLTFLYNDAYGVTTLGAKHPWALGRPFREVWAEVYEDVEARVHRVLQTGEATWDEGLRLFLERNGFPEETYHTFSYSPVSDDSGRVAGLLCVVSEETERVLSVRRMALLADTGSAMASAMTAGELFHSLERTTTGARDLPFALVYRLDAHDARGTLACRAGLPADHPAAAAEVSFAGPDALWPYDPSGPTVAMLTPRHGTLPGGPWPRPPAQALVVPIPDHAHKTVAGVLVAGLNPFRPLDEAYRAFIELFVAQIASGMANARAYEEERRRSQALAELDRAKTTFFSNVSHEFRTPLTLLLGPLEDIRRDERIPDALRQPLEVSHRNGQRLLKLVNTLLDFSRIEAGRHLAHFERVELDRLTTDLASAFRSAMDQAGLAYEVRVEPMPRPVYVDRELWEKVVLNLISNAFKFTLAGGITVTLTGESHGARLSVRDTGVGIDADELPRVFERFHRVQGSGGRSHEGSGIGLALVQELVRLHGGELSATSERGAGSEFTVVIPYGSVHLPPDQVHEATPGAAPGASDAFVREAIGWLPASAAPDAEAAPDEAAVPATLRDRVLVADDNADMRAYASRLLAERFDVEAVANGREALEAARARTPDVIVSDVMMPELDGFELLREIRRDPELSSIPVVLLSARAGEEARHEGLAASADDYLVKPFSARDLMARVETQVVKARVRRIERRHARDLFRIFAQAPVAVAVLSGPDHVIELMNPRCLDLVGGRDVAGLPLRAALPELEGQGLIETLDRVRQTGEPFVGDAVHLRLRTGPERTLEDNYFDFVYQPLGGDRGNTDRIVVIGYDVTALSAAKLEAETASRLKDEFLATLSHELRTPLNSVLGYVQMLRRGLIDASGVPAALETVERNVRLQERLISDVLDVSRIITGNLRLDIQPADLPLVIREALETVTPAAHAKGVRLQSALDQPGVPVAGDPQRLQQVVWNLLSNAIKFTPRGGRVQVRLARVNSHVEITVSDTGEGIAPEFLPHLFQRFRQADSTFTRRHGGLGLGLAICRHLIEAHGGRISAESPGRGQGTTVRVELPLMIVHGAPGGDAGRVHPSALPPAPADVALANLSGVRVLLVDDDTDALRMATMVLTAAGAHVVAAPGGVEALEALDRERVDAVVLDIGLPGMDGYALLDAIRARPASRQGLVPAAALTAYARSVDRTRSLQAGFQLHLVKPVEAHELTAAIRGLAARRVDGAGSPEGRETDTVVPAAMSESLQPFVTFILELDKLKAVTRKTRPLGLDRYENSAEHSWQIAMLAASVAHWRRRRSGSTA